MLAPRTLLSGKVWNSRVAGDLRRHDAIWRHCDDLPFLLVSPQPHMPVVKPQVACTEKTSHKVLRWSLDFHCYLKWPGPSSHLCKKPQKFMARDPITSSLAIRCVFGHGSISKSFIRVIKIWASIIGVGALPHVTLCSEWFEKMHLKMWSAKCMASMC